MIDLDLSDFWEKYTPDERQSIAFDSEDETGMFETYGADLDYVLDVARRKPRCVWTALDEDDGFYYVNGYHLVNRVYYVITNEHGEENETYKQF